MKRFICSAVIINLFVVSVIAQGNKQKIINDTSVNESILVWSWVDENAKDLVFPTDIKTDERGWVAVLFSYENKILLLNEQGEPVLSKTIPSDSGSSTYLMEFKKNKIFLKPTSGKYARDCIVLDVQKGEFNIRQNEKSLNGCVASVNGENIDDEIMSKIYIKRNVGKSNKILFDFVRGTDSKFIDFSVVGDEVENAIYQYSDNYGLYYVLLRKKNVKLQYEGPRGDVRFGDDYWISVLNVKGEVIEWFKLKTSVVMPVIAYSDNRQVFQLWADNERYYISKWTIR